MILSPLSCTAEVHDSRSQCKKQVNSGISYCGFACAAYQRRQVLTICGYSKRKERVINSSEMEQFIQKTTQTQKKITKQNKQKHKTQDTLRKNSYEKAAETRKNTSGNGHKNNLLQGKQRVYCSLTVTASAYTLIQQLPQNEEFTCTSPHWTEL